MGFNFPAPSHRETTSGTYDPAVPSDPRIAGNTLSPAGIQAIHDQLMTRLGCVPGQNKFTDFDPVANGPFWERGELSQLTLFNSGTLASSGTISMAQVNDRAREEIFRRMAEMITTRGAFTRSMSWARLASHRLSPAAPPGRPRRR